MLEATGEPFSLLCSGVASVTPLSYDYPTATKLSVSYVAEWLP